MAKDHRTGTSAGTRDEDEFRRFLADNFGVETTREIFEAYPFAFNDGLCDGEFHEVPCPIREVETSMRGMRSSVIYRCMCTGQSERGIADMPYIRFLMQVRRVVGEAGAEELWWVGQCPECWTVYFARTEADG
jgi:hypothetical protein